jgi:hypothetical protein
VSPTRPILSLWQRIRRDDRGAGYLAAFIVLFSVLGVVCVGILIDTARIMSSARQTDSIALEAARAGANAIDIAQSRSGATTLNVGEAQAAASGAAASFVSASGATLTSVSVNGNRVTVTVSAVVDPWFPVMSTRTVSSTAGAEAIVGVNSP